MNNSITSLERCVWLQKVCFNDHKCFTWLASFDRWLCLDHWNAREVSFIFANGIAFNTINTARYILMWVNSYFVEWMLKMHYTGKIRKTGCGWHLTACPITSHLPKCKQCKPSMLVAPANLWVCYVNIGIHWNLEVAPKSLIPTF